MKTEIFYPPALFFLEDLLICVARVQGLLADIYASTGLSYDLAENGADFVLNLPDRSNIVIEVGFNKETVLQVENTLDKTGGRYGLVFGSRKLEMAGDSIVKVPLRYLLLS